MLKDQTYFNYLTARKTGTPKKRDSGPWTHEDPGPYEDLGPKEDPGL